MVHCVYAMSQAKRHASLLVVNFFLWRNCPGTIDSVKFLERRLGPNTETANVTTRSNFQQIEMVDINQCDARYVAEGPTNAVVLRIDDYWPTALDTSAVSHFANTSTKTSWILHLHMRASLLTSRHVMHCGLFKSWSKCHDIYCDTCTHNFIRKVPIYSTIHTAVLHGRIIRRCDTVALQLQYRRHFPPLLRLGSTAV